MTTADATIQWVESNYLGKGEPFPPKYGEWIPFQERWGYPPNVIVEWCGGLWTDSTFETGGTVGPLGTMPNTWWTVSGAQQYMQRGDWVPADGRQAPQRGWDVFYDWGNGGWISEGDLLSCNRIDHVERVTDGSMWSASTGWAFETIGGNVAERCGRFRRYDNATVVGFGRPRYTNTTQPPTPPPLTFTVAPEYTEKYAGLEPALGLPIGPRSPFFNTSHMFQPFQHGVIIENGGEPRAVYGSIYVQWTREGIRAGMPISDEQDALGVDGGRMSVFEHGVIVWTGPSGAHLLNGPIGQWWLSSSAESRAALGAPLSTVNIFQPDLPGRGAEFQHGWLMYSEGNGVHPVYGEVANIYSNRGSQGLGYPIGPVETVNGRRRQRFTNADVILP